MNCIQFKFIHIYMWYCSGILHFPHSRSAFILIAQKKTMNQFEHAKLHLMDDIYHEFIW